ncbi:MAG: acyltransferase [Planctomycetes bacterium]|nr:acyltransferase [Planctomycetota bacterium]
MVTIIPSDSTRRVESLDAIRGLAATAVVAFHMVHLGHVDKPDAFAFVGTHFGLGVTAFFVLSAFSLFWTNDGRVGTPGFARDYLVRRIARICPLFYAMLAFWVAVRWFQFGVPTPVREILLNATFTFNIVPGSEDSLVAAGWTLGIEMIVYGVILVALLVIRSLWAAVIALVVSLVVADAGFTSISRVEGLSASYSMHSVLTHLPAFAMGVVAYRVARRLPPWPARRGVLLAWAGVLCVPGLYLIGPLLAGVTTPYYFAMWSLAFAVVAATNIHTTTRVLTNPATVFLGKVSYSLYLLHPYLVSRLEPVYGWCQEACGESKLLGFCACLAMTMAILVPLSELSFRFIELPGMRLGKRLLTPRDSAAVDPGTLITPPASSPRRARANG